MTEAYDDQIICGEGYGPGGVAVIVTCREPSRAIAAAVRDEFAAHGGHSGAAGSVAYLFNVVGLIEFDATTPLARTRAFAYEAGAEDVVLQADGRLLVQTDPAETQRISAQLLGRGCRPVSTRVAQRAASGLVVDDEQGQHLQRLLDALRGIDGVTHVYSNAQVPSLLA